MIKDGELRAIVNLLDDTDEEVVRAAEARLFAEGPDVVPLLENCWTDNKDPFIAFRIETIIRSIQQQQLEADFTIWRDTGGADLLSACLLVNRIHYPGLNPDMVFKYLDKVRLDAWMAMYSAGNPLDKIQLLNHILFERHGFSGNTTNYHVPDNSFIHRVIETRKGNPISLCNLYSVIAQRLGMPVFGVNLPQHFVLAWCEEQSPQAQVPYNSPPALDRKDYGRVLFYINPFSKGQVFMKKNIDDFLQAIKVEARAEFYEPCDNQEILRRMLRNLHYAYAEIHNEEKLRETEVFMRIMGMTGED